MRQCLLFLPLALLLPFLPACHSPTLPLQNVGGPCESCPGFYEGQPDHLTHQATIPGSAEYKNTLVVNGRTLNAQGKPVPDVVIYAYQTNPGGRYAPLPRATGYAQRHGQHRAWARTDARGNYSFRTFRPGPYPGRNLPAHIHFIVGEPGYTPYYIDDITFPDDSLMTENLRTQLPLRGGNGCILPEQTPEGPTVTRDILLGVRIPGHPDE